MSPSLKVGVVGAGIAGLAAATALAQAGHQVAVFEKSRFKSEVGAAINACPNATRILAQWGFDMAKWAPTTAKDLKVLLPNGAVASHHSHAAVEKLYGAPYYLFHRVDLHSGLKETAVKSGAVIHTASEVVEVDCDSGRITLIGNQNHQLDLIVIADGVHSPYVKLINGNAAQAEATGYSIYRWLAPIDQLQADPRTRSFVETSAEQGLTIRVVDPETRLVHYPCRNNTLMNFGAIHPNHKHSHSGPLVEDFDAQGDVDGLVNIYSSLGDDVTKVCQGAKDLKLWPLMFREPLDKWYRGKAILIGDAAHPMLPHQGQGGCQAIEDGAALGVLLADTKPGDDIEPRLALVESVRKWRTSTIQYMSNVAQDQQELSEEKVRQVIGDRDVPKTMDQIHDFNFGYDVTKDSRRVLTSANGDVKS